MPDQISSEAQTLAMLSSVPNKPWYEQGEQSLDRIAEYAERAREHAPTIISIDKTSGLPIANTYTTSQRLRILRLIVSISTADHVSIAFGGRTFDWYLAAGLTTIELPYEVDRGIDIVFTDITSADNAYTVLLIAYPE